MPWIIMFTLVIWHAEISADVTAKQCQKVKPSIAKLQHKLRQGYAVKKGEQLKKKLRRLEKLRYQCMKKRLPTS